MSQSKTVMLLVALVVGVCALVALLVPGSRPDPATPDPQGDEPTPVTPSPPADFDPGGPKLEAENRPARRKDPAKNPESIWKDSLARLTHVSEVGLPGRDAFVRAAEKSDREARRVLLSALAEAKKYRAASWLTIAEAIDPLPAELGPVLARKLRATDEYTARDIEEWITKTKADLRPIAGPVLSALLGRLGETEGQPGHYHVLAIGSLGIGGERVTEPLLRMVREADSVRTSGGWAALAALERLGPAAADVGPDLIDWYPDAPSQLKPQAVTVLGALRSPAALPFFADLLRKRSNANLNEVSRVPGALVQCDPRLESPAGVALMRDLLADEWVRYTTLQALVGLEHVPEFVADAFLAAFDGESRHFRNGTEHALRKLAVGEGNPRAFRSLLLTLARRKPRDEKSARVQALALSALALIDPLPSEVMKLLVEALGSEHRSVWHMAVAKLEEHRPTPEDRALLERLAKRPDPDVAKRARKVLWQWRSR